MSTRQLLRRAGMRVETFVDWFDKRPGLAAWASAFAAVVALVLTLWLAFSNSKQSEAQAVAAATNYGRQAMQLMERYVAVMERYRASANAIEHDSSTLAISPADAREQLLKDLTERLFTIEQMATEVEVVGRTLRLDQLPAAKIPTFMEVRLLIVRGRDTRVRFNYGRDNAGKPLHPGRIGLFSQEINGVVGDLRVTLKNLEKA